ncbi:hypothetical protein [Rhodococcus sp. ACT016]|uniref:hypothetical protein n=1 Tax=Rhodococcus sp. ACT016 TaxID=3134808 RepID=UPI003D284851
MAVLLLVGPAVVHLIRNRVSTRGRHVKPRLSMPRLALAKAILVALAIVQTLLLETTVPGTRYLIGVEIALAIAIAGPALHRRMLVGPPAAPVDTADSSRRSNTDKSR